MVYKVVEADVESNVAEDTTSTHPGCAEGDVEDSVALQNTY